MKPTDKPQLNAPRRPSSFTIGDDGHQTAQAAPARRPKSFDEPVQVTPEDEDPFAGTDALVDEKLPVAEPRRRKGFSFLGLTAAALGTFLSLAFGLWADQVVRDLFLRADWLGYAAVTTLLVAAIALLIVIGREIAGIAKLAAVQNLKVEAEEASSSSHPAAARKVVERLVVLLSHRPETARGRAALDSTKDDIIDGPHLVELAEKELLSPLDRKARGLILNASKRVAVVTAISPRAVVDLAYVLLEVTRLVRAMAELYGARPGRLGLLRLMRDVIAHLAVTGSIAVGDSLAQQLLGHGLASRVSRRLGEGVINGLLTARIGIAAMDLCRPLPFKALPRPGIGDFLSDIASVGRQEERD